MNLLGIERRYINLLAKAGYTTPDDFENTSAYKLSKIRGIGKTTAQRILKAVVDSQWEAERKEVRRVSAEAEEQETEKEPELENVSVRVRRIKMLN